jgi:hypothetical protein
MRVERLSSAEASEEESDLGDEDEAFVGGQGGLALSEAVRRSANAARPWTFVPARV